MHARLSLALSLLIAACGPPATPDAGPPTAPVSPPAPLTLTVSDCRSCHQAIVDRYVSTAHFQTSAQATAQSIHGSFAQGRNRVGTRVPETWFTMEQAGDQFYQIAVDGTRLNTRQEQFDLVIGSGRKGQSYLYWRAGVLFQLPISYLVANDSWINSPGYSDGVVDFDRVIVPRCLECHSTTFRLEESQGRVVYSPEYLVGISCEKCHGDARDHVAYHTANPTDSTGQQILALAELPRERQLDNCALCHSGMKDPKRPPFSYRAGEPITEYLQAPAGSDSAVPDVHGDQVALLGLSRCFQASPDMSCSTCHDVHQPERDLDRMAGKCLACHQTEGHPMLDQIGDRLRSACIDCHMPDQPSRALEFNTPTGRFGPDYRNHRIGIYPDQSTKLLSPG